MHVEVHYRTLRRSHNRESSFLEQWQSRNSEGRGHVLILRFVTIGVFHIYIY